MADRVAILREADIDGAQVRIAFEGPVDPIVKAVARHEVTEIHPRDGDLEDVFLRYYQDPSS